MHFDSIGYATVLDINMTEQGLFVRLEAQPIGEEINARVLRPDSGPGYGFHAPVSVDDTILFACPSNDPADGVYVLGSWHEKAEPPPQFAKDDPDARGWRTKKGGQLRLEVDGAKFWIITDGDGGDIILKLAGAAGLVQLGSDEATDFVVKGDTYRTAEDSLFSALKARLVAAGGFLNTAGTDTTLITLASAAAAALVNAGAQLSAIAAAFTTFQNTADKYLSTKVKTV